MTTHFYVPPGLIKGDRIALPDDEARHASRVLRVKKGDEIAVVDGEGGWYRVRIDHADRRQVVGHILERRSGVGEPHYRLTVAMAVVKQRGRFETFLEKAVELGVSEVVPILSERTERDHIRLERSESKLIAAMKQCGRSRLVQLQEPMTFDAFLRREAPDLGLCCHEAADHESHVLRVLQASARPHRVCVLVGPEGGFTDAEIRGARSAGWQTASLGPRRLRAETSAIAAVAAVAFVYDSA